MFFRYIYVLIIFGGSVLRAQEFVFRNYNSKDGLPTNECYGALSAKNGHMWFRTMNGICRFNGKQFDVFGKKKGLSNLSVYSFYEDSEGKLWFSNSFSEVGFIDKDSVFSIPVTNQIANALGNGKDIIHSIFLDSSRNLYLTTTLKTFIVLADSNYIKYKVLKRDTSVNGEIIKVNGTYFQFVTAENVLPWNRAQREIIRYKIRNRVISFDWSIQQYGYSFSPAFNRIYESEAGDMYLSAFRKQLFCIRKNGKGIETKNYEKDVLTCLIDRSNNLWIGLRIGGVLCYPNCDLSSTPIHSLKDLSVSDVVQDFEGGIWATTLEKGLFYCCNTSNLSYAPILNQTFKSGMLKLIDSLLFISDFKNNLFSLNIPKQALSHVVKYNAPTHDGFLDIIKSFDGSRYILSSRTVILELSKRLTNPRRIEFIKHFRDSGNKFRTYTNRNVNHLAFQSMGAFRLSYNSDSVLYALSRKNLLMIPKGQVIDFPDRAGDGIFYHGTYYVAANKNLYKYENYAFSKVFLPLERIDIARLLTDRNYLYVISKGNGVYRLDSGCVAKKIYEGEERINDACLYKDSLLLLATGSGLTVIDCKRSTVFSLATKDGLLDNELFLLACYRGIVFYSTNTGIASINLNTLEKGTKGPRLNFNGMLCNGQKWIGSENIFPFNSSLAFKFDLVSFRNGEDAVINFRVLGDNDRWESTSGNSVKLNNLASGNYSLQVIARNSLGLSSPTYSYVFIISQPFYKRFEFLVLVFLALTSLILGMYRIVYKRIEKKANEKERVHKLIMQYQLVSLKSQMNPHFIFNSLSSIQHYILERSPTDAITYVSKFSKLIRSVLNNSDKGNIRLSDEMDHLNLYIELEQRRVGNRFTYEFYQDEDVNLDDIKIPALLLQSYVENAIWHGLLNLEKDVSGTLSISIRKYEEGAIIIVQDDGVGRKKSMERTNKSHISKGLEITEKRIDAFNKMMDYHFITVTIADLMPRGTSVTLILK